MSKLLGKATEIDTKNYADRMWKKNPKISPDTWRVFEGLTISKVGFGTYRTIGTEEHKAALKKALLNGMNIIDTANNYLEGDSEKFIGEILTELNSKNFLKREEVVIISKGGYLQGENLLNAKSNNIQEIIEITDTLWHSIHPSNINLQLNQSLKNLNVETIDCYLLHNPEYFIGHSIIKTGGKKTDEIEELYYQRIEDAFVFLEEQVKEGKISCYGISSNTLAVSKEQGDHTDLAKVFTAAQNAAQKAWGRKKRPAFRCIQMPFNLLELDPLKNINTTAQVIDGEEEVSTLELASKMKLNVITNRPLNSFPLSGGIYRLSDGYSHEEKEIKPVNKCLSKVKETEEALNKVLNGWPSINEQPIFSFTAHSEELLEQITNSIQLDHMVSMFLLPHTAMMNHVLDEIIKEQPEIAESIKIIKENFTSQTQELFRSLRKDMRQKDSENLKILEIELRNRVNGYWKNSPLQQIAINAISSVPGVTSVLCGLRRKSYVDDAINIFEKGNFKDPAAIIGASEELEVDISAGDIKDIT